MSDQLAEIWRYRQFMGEYLRAQMHTRYRGSVLGFLWTLLHPILFCTMFSIVFSYVNHQDLKAFGLMFFTAYIPWVFFSNSVSTCAVSVLGNPNYVTRIYVPKLIFPVVFVAIQAIDLVIGMLVVIVLALVWGKELGLPLIVLPLSTLLLAMFAMGFGIAFAAGTVFLRDLTHLWVSLSLMWFFLNPIMYPLSVMPANLLPYFNLNPFLPFIHLFRDPVALGVFPSGGNWLAAGLIAIGTLILSSTFFMRSQRSFFLYL